MKIYWFLSVKLYSEFFYYTVFFEVIFFEVIWFFSLLSLPSLLLLFVCFVLLIYFPLRLLTKLILANM